jgi:hypothetical protein
LPWATVTPGLCSKTSLAPSVFVVPAIPTIPPAVGLPRGRILYSG